MIHRIGFIGCGGNAQLHLEGYKSLNNVEVVAAADISELALNRMREKWEIKDLYSDYKEMLQRDDIEIIVISVPEVVPGIPDFHVDVAIDVCNAGKHVLCEKPLAQSVNGARKILAVAKKTGVKFMVGQNFRWFPQYEAVKKIIDEKMIGKPLALYFEDFRWQEGYQKQHGETWRDQLEKNLMIKACIHFVDLFHWWLEKNPKRVFAVTNTTPHMISLGIKGETNCIMIMDYGDDCFGQINFCWHSHSGWTERLKIIGTDGNIECTDKLRVRSKKLGGLFEPNLERDFITPPGTTMHHGGPELPWSMSVQMSKLIEAIEKNVEPITNIEDNIGVLKTIFACYESAKTGKSVEIKK